MSSLDRAITRVRNGLQIDGRTETVGAESVVIVLKNSSGQIAYAYGATVPTDATVNYAKGCIFVHTAGGAGNTIYVNEGTAASSDFNVAALASGDITAVVAGSGLTGGGTSGSVTLTIASFPDQATIGATLADTAIVLGRIATGSVAGAALDVGATYTRTEGQEYRYEVSDWTGKSEFKAAYFRAEATADGASNSIIGVEVFGVANGVGVANIQGVLGWGYIKGDTAETFTGIYGVHGEFSMDAGRAQTATITEAAGLYARITSGKVDDYTKIHGVIVRAGDMDGGSRTYGSIIYAPESAAESGTSAFSNFFYTDMVLTALIKVSADGKGGLTVGAIPNANPENDAEDAWIAVLVGSTQYAIPLYATAA